MNTPHCILLYVKYPEAGRVKTRLARTIGNRHAVAVYRCFLADMLAMLQCADPNSRHKVCICYAPQSAESAFRSWLGDEYVYCPQHGSDLGDRMSDSFWQAFQAGYGKAVLIGGDLPDLPADHVTTAFAQLDTHDVVIGPTNDGGYYLIGFRQDSFAPEIFHEMTWSTMTVYAQTVRKIEALGRTYARLPEWWDVDVEDDIRQLLVRNRESGRAPQTLEYLRRYQVINRVIP